MKKVILFVIIFVGACSSMFAQLQSIGTYRIASVSTAFGHALPQGTVVIDKSNGDCYLLTSDVAANQSISGLSIGANYRKLLSYITADGKIPGLDADLLDGHHASYFQVSGNYDNYVSWTVKDDQGTAVAVTRGFPLAIQGGGLISTQYDAVNKSIQITTTANNYTLPVANSGVLGGVKIGNGISIASGVISADVQTDNNFTNTYKSKLDGIASGAEVNVNADWNAVSGDAAILNKPTTIQGYGITDANSNQTFVIEDNNGAAQWTLSVDNTTKVLQFKNATGVIRMTLDQNGNLKIAGDVQAYTSF